MLHYATLYYIMLTDLHSLAGWPVGQLALPRIRSVETQHNTSVNINNINNSNTIIHNHINNI